MVEGGSTPVLSAPELAELGYTLVIFPATAFLAMGAAVRSVYQHLMSEGSTSDVTTPLYDFKDFSRLMGFDEVWDFEKKWADADSAG